MRTGYGGRRPTRWPTRPRCRPRPRARSTRDHYQWTDDAWIEKRRQTPLHASPISIYEVHLGSWRMGLSYVELARELVDYVKDMGFTHVEFLPVAEHPFGGSWGYQVSSYYAPTTRFGAPDEFRYLVDTLHNNGIGVIVDWVPAHFPKDEWALGRFDGTALYEHPDPRRGEQPDWGTYVFDFGRREVRNFLVANALYWMEEFHIDGLRVDAVASMLYLDYSRAEGDWLPNVYGGRENLDAVAFLQETTATVLPPEPRHRDHRRGVDGVAGRDPADAPGRPRLRLQMEHGLDARHARLRRARAHLPALPPPPDDVLDDVRVLRELHPADQPRRGRARQGLAAGQDARRPVAATGERPGAAGLHVGASGQAAAVHGQRVRPGDSNGRRRARWTGGCSTCPTTTACGCSCATSTGSTGRRGRCGQPRRRRRPGFTWIDANDADHNVFSFLRWGDDGSVLACIANFAGNPHEGYRIGLPKGGRWAEVVNTDSELYCGSGVGELGAVEAPSRAGTGSRIRRVRHEESPRSPR